MLESKFTRILSVIAYDYIEELYEEFELTRYEDKYIKLQYPKELRIPDIIVKIQHAFLPGNKVPYEDLIDIALANRVIYLEEDALGLPFIYYIGINHPVSKIVFMAGEHTLTRYDYKQLIASHYISLEP